MLSCFSALEGAESTLVMASGMCANTVMLLALVPKGGHIVTTSDCYKETRTFMETFLPKLGITVEKKNQFHYYPFVRFRSPSINPLSCLCVCVCTR